MVGRRSMCQSAVFGCRGVTILWQFLGRCPAASRHLPPTPPTSLRCSTILLFPHQIAPEWLAVPESICRSDEHRPCRRISCSRHALCAGPVPPPPLQGQMEGDSSGRLGHVYWPLLSQKNRLSVYMYAGRRRTTMTGIEASLCRRRRLHSVNATAILFLTMSEWSDGCVYCRRPVDR